MGVEFTIPNDPAELWSDSDKLSMLVSDHSLDFTNENILVHHAEGTSCDPFLLSFMRKSPSPTNQQRPTNVTCVLSSGSTIRCRRIIVFSVWGESVMCE